MEYRINKKSLLDTFSAWDGYLRRRARLIACGGTAMTLLDIKASTKDIDLLVPQDKEYDYLIGILQELGYKPVSGHGWAKDAGFVFDIFRGRRIHTTELLTSPLEKDGHYMIKEFRSITLGVLNEYDLLISKLFRGSSVDVEDCLALAKARRKNIDLGRLEARFRQTASYDISEEKVNKNLNHFLEILHKEGLCNEK
jgi:hypothetical protein